MTVYRVTADIALLGVRAGDVVTVDPTGVVAVTRALPIKADDVDALVQLGALTADAGGVSPSPGRPPTAPRRRAPRGLRLLR